MPKYARAPVRASRSSLRIKAVVDGSPTVDVYFDGHRIWSVKLPAQESRSASRYLRWPLALRPYLRGSSRLQIRNSATDDVITEAEVSFGGPGRVAIVDAAGRWLAMNKWNRLGPVFEGDSSGVQQRLLDSAAGLAEQMQQWGYPIYIVGGTLLGALRNGGLLPHDDDIDFAFWTDKTDVQDVTLVSFEVQRKLEDAGHVIVRHSHAHLEAVFFTDDGGTDYYIDIFTGYHSEDGLYNQPFALRDPLPLDQLLPPRPIEVNGTSLPGPAVPEAWCAYAYGPDWLIPDPAFRWSTPRTTLRMFENSFGVFNRQRVYWEKLWQQVDKRDDTQPVDLEDAQRFLRMLPPGAFVVDLGCGDGRQAEFLAAAGHDVLALDYSFEALRVARQTQPAGVEYRFVNFNDRHELLRLGLELLAGGRQPYFFARDLLNQLPALGRADLFTMLRGVLDAQTFLYASFDATPVRRSRVDPQTWTLNLRTLRREAWRWKLGLTSISRQHHPTRFGERTRVGVLLWSADTDTGAGTDNRAATIASDGAPTDLYSYDDEGAL